MSLGLELTPGDPIFLSLGSTITPIRPELTITPIRLELTILDLEDIINRSLSPNSITSGIPIIGSPTLSVSGEGIPGYDEITYDDGVYR